MLRAQPARKFDWPFTARVGSWQARQSCELELSRTRNSGRILSIFSKCGSWQVVHSMVLLISRTTGSAVFGGTPDNNAIAFRGTTSGGCTLEGGGNFKGTPENEGR